MKNVIINGFALGFAKKITGIQRACKELLIRLDALCENSDFKIKYIYDKNDLNIIIDPTQFKNIEPIPLTRDKKFLWKTRSIRKMLKKENAILCCLSHETAFCKNQVNFIYDVRPATQKFDPLKFRIKYKIYLYLQKHMAKYILTDSNFQKNELVRYMHFPESRIFTLYMGHEHYLNVEPDYSIFTKIKNDIPEFNGDFYYTLGSLAPHKNFKWIMEVAKNNPKSFFIIAGGKDLEVWKDNVENKSIDNVHFVGYITDEESKALMTKCKAFIHPSFYEGFGIPPLEALVSGAKIIVSQISCLSEIYEDSAYYINPYEYDVNLDKLLEKSVSNPKDVINKCSWDKSANDLYEVLSNVVREF